MQSTAHSAWHTVTIQYVGTFIIVSVVGVKVLSPGRQEASNCLVYLSRAEHSFTKRVPKTLLKG